jgi:hypothetical protein
MVQLQEAWKAHATRRSEFAALLQEPAMQDALAIVREKCYEPRPMPAAGVTLMEWTALLGSRREGYLECLTNLLSLANISPHKAPDRKPWETPRSKEEPSTEKK